MRLLPQLHCVCVCVCACVSVLACTTQSQKNQNRNLILGSQTDFLKDEMQYPICMPTVAISHGDGCYNGCMNKVVAAFCTVILASAALSIASSATDGVFPYHA